MLIAHLPADAATRAALDEGAPWGLNEHLLAAVLDTLRAGNWQRGGGKSARPKPIPRPGVDQQRTRHLGTTDLDPAVVANYLAQLAPPADAGAN